VNGQVVRTIGKTAVGSIDLIRSVDSKFEIVRSVEKVLKEAVSNSKASKVGTGAGTGTGIHEIPDSGQPSEGEKVSSGKIDFKNKKNSSLIDISAKKFP
jgi:hypothetical protein